MRHADRGATGSDDSAGGNGSTHPAPPAASSPRRTTGFTYTRVLTLALGLTLLGFLWLAHGTWKVWHEGREAHGASDRREAIRAVALLDDLTRATASLAAGTGEDPLRLRHADLARELDAAIDRVAGLDPATGREMRAAHDRILALEGKALDHARAGDPDLAGGILSSEDPADARAAAAAGWVQLAARLGAGPAPAPPVRRRTTLIRNSALVAAIAVLLILWMAILRRRRHEDMIRRTRRTEDLLASISSILIGVDGQGRVVNWNATAARIFGLAQEAVVGRPFRNCGITWDWEAVEQATSECLQDRRAVRITPFRFLNAKGEEGTLGATVNPVAQESADGLSYLLLAADLTEHAAMESMLLQAQKLESVGQLAAGIAHEINTPTQYVGDNTRFLQEVFGEVLELTRDIETLTREGDAPPPDLAARIRDAMAKVDLAYLRDEIPRAIQQALEGIERVSKIVRAMKEYSHPAQDRAAIDLNRAIDSTVTVARNEWKYVAEMVLDLDPSLPPVTCHPGVFNQIILNLVVNAADAIGDLVKAGTIEKGTITVSTRRDGDGVEIRVADTGAGIPEAIGGRIFDPFFTTKAVGKGTGQGLSLVHSAVVQKHGGRITFETQVGRGTTFVIHLPLWEEPAFAQEAVQ